MKVDPNSAEGKAAVETARIAAEKTAAELAAKPFTELAQLKVPEGLKLDEALMKDFLPLAGKVGLTAAQAQALVEFNAKSSTAAETARVAKLEAAQTAATEALKADKDFGGANLEKSMKLVGRALTKFGGKDVDALLELRLADGSFVGDNPAFAKLLSRFGAAMSEDSVGNAHTSALNTKPKSLGDLMYGPGTVEAGPNAAGQNAAGS